MKAEWTNNGLEIDPEGGMPEVASLLKKVFDEHQRKHRHLDEANKTINRAREVLAPYFPLALGELGEPGELYGPISLAEQTKITRWIRWGKQASKSWAVLRRIKGGLSKVGRSRWLDIVPWVVFSLIDNGPWLVQNIMRALGIWPETAHKETSTLYYSARDLIDDINYAFSKKRFDMVLLNYPALLKYRDLIWSRLKDPKIANALKQHGTYDMWVTIARTLDYYAASYSLLLHTAGVMPSVPGDVFNKANSLLESWAITNFPSIKNDLLKWNSGLIQVLGRKYPWLVAYNFIRDTSKGATATTYYKSPSRVIYYYRPASKYYSSKYKGYYSSGYSYFKLLYYLLEKQFALLANLLMLLLSWRAPIYYSDALLTRYGDRYWPFKLAMDFMYNGYGFPMPVVGEARLPSVRIKSKYNPDFVPRAKYYVPTPYRRWI